MRLSYISFLIMVILFSGCGSNSLLIKKRYNKGFYANRPNKIKTESVAFLSYSFNTAKEQITVTKQENELTAYHLNDKPTLEKPTHQFRAAKALIQHRNNSIDDPKQTLKQINKNSYNDQTQNRHFISGAALVIVLAMLVALAKVFGILFIYATSFIIAFTAISIFFIIRTHLN
ncbi:MAG: hypothetical protein IPG08_03430 [Sphingobacteriaceae bacterium]|nr:hypothetical protein [Sphingobacteriaceae bacterium]